jgi:nitroreductase
MSDTPPSLARYREWIAAAMSAPSSHNTQPWCFHVAPPLLELLADRTRALPVNDPHDRELTISCCAALMNVRIAAAHAGYAATTQLLPDMHEPDLLARVHMASAAGAPPAEGALAEFMRARRTWRQRFEPRDVPAAVLDALTRAVQAEGAWLRPITHEAARLDAARLVAEGDAVQWADARWRRELAAWMHPRRRGDGLTVPALAAPVAQMVVRTFDMGGGVGAKDRQLAEASPLLAVIGTDTDDAAAWLQTGQALQRALLVACRHGLQASYLNQPVQVDALRPQLAALVQGAYPQLLLRLGYPTGNVPPAPRRPVEEVLTSEAAC